MFGSGSGISGCGPSVVVSAVGDGNEVSDVDEVPVGNGMTGNEYRYNSKKGW